MNGFTFFVSVVLAVALAWPEVQWLRDGPPGAGVAWPALAAVAAFNVVALLVMTVGLLVIGGYIGLFIVPLPVLPALYIVGKSAVYWITCAAMGWPAGFGIVGMAFLAMLAQPLATIAAVWALHAVDPTNENLCRAVEAGRRWHVALMLRLCWPDEDLLRMLLNEALRHDRPRMLDLLIRFGADPYDCDPRDCRHPATLWRLMEHQLRRGGLSADLLYQTVDFGVTELRHCLEQGFDPKDAPLLIHTVIGHAADMADPPTEAEIADLLGKLGLLLEHGADVGSVSQGVTPLVDAVRMGRDLAPVVRFLLDKGADIDARTRSPMFPPKRAPLPMGMTPLMVAVDGGHAAAVRVLLERGADLSLRDDEGADVWDHAARPHVPEGVRSLLPPKPAVRPAVAQ
jgi:hypothetical protein